MFHFRSQLSYFFSPSLVASYQFIRVGGWVPTHLKIYAQIGSWNPNFSGCSNIPAQDGDEKHSPKKKKTFRNLKLHSIPKMFEKLHHQNDETSFTLSRHSIQRSRSHLVRFLPLYLGKLQGEEPMIITMIWGLRFPCNTCFGDNFFLASFFQVTFWFPKWRSLNPRKGHLKPSKRSLGRTWGLYISFNTKIVISWSWCLLHWKNPWFYQLKSKETHDKSAKFGGIPSPKTCKWVQKIGLSTQKETCVFQPLIFRCNSLVFGVVCLVHIFQASWFQTSKSKRCV